MKPWIESTSHKTDVVVLICNPRTRRKEDWVFKVIPCYIFKANLGYTRLWLTGSLGQRHQICLELELQVFVSC